LSKYTPTDYFFGDFAHWVVSYFIVYTWMVVV